MSVPSLTRWLLWGTLLAVAPSACDDPLVVVRSDSFTVVLEKKLVVADGVDASLIEVSLPESTPKGTEVRFVATAGSLAGAPTGKPSTLTVVAGDRIARTSILSAGEVGPARVFVSAAGRTEEVSLDFAHALPTAVALSSSRAVAPADGSTQVSFLATLARDAGSVSPGQTATLVAETGSSGLDSLLTRASLSSASSVAFSVSSPDTATALFRVRIGEMLSNAVVVRFAPVPAGAPPMN